MVAVAAGPPLAVDGPLPVPPAYNLLTAAQIVDDGDPHWLLGVFLNGYPVDQPLIWDPCSTGTFRPKEEGEGSLSPMFGPFVAYLPIKCTTRGIDRDTFQNRAVAAFQAKESFAVEQALVNAPHNTANPHFTDSNVVVLAGGAAQTPAAGMAYLEDAIGETAASGVIHATPAISSAWGTTYAENRNGRRYSAGNGTPIAVGAGYIGAVPDSDDADDDPPVAGTGWAFATGPVQIRRTEIELVPRTLAEALDRAQNNVIYRAERGYVAVWDTALQVAVLIDWSP